MHPIVAWGTVIPTHWATVPKQVPCSLKLRSTQQILAISIHVGGSKPMDSQKSRSTRMYVHERGSGSEKTGLQSSALAGEVSLSIAENGIHLWLGLAT